ncbi:MAG: cyclic nucleotide-binding domain-containing protein [Deltaproteobacteria bacterium]|nr:cyclic nucleotide-binding domain-containing protein [Deltaproteobacteria bacterium]
MTAARTKLVRLPGVRLRGRILTTAKVFIVAAALLTLLAVNALTATTLSLFLIFGQAFIVVGALLAVFVAATDFLRTRGTSQVHIIAGENVFRQGDSGDLVYVIVTGEVEVPREEPDGSETLLATMGPGEYFGEMALLSDAPRTATVRARTALEAIAMARADFTTLYAYFPNLRRNVEKVMKERRAQHAGKAIARTVLAAILLGASAGSADAEGDATRGQDLYVKQGCPQCHGHTGKGDGYLLSMLKEKPVMRDSSDPKVASELTDPFLIEIIEKGGQPLGKSPIMLKYGHKLTRPQIEDIVTYLRTLPK